MWTSPQTRCNPIGNVCVSLCSPFVQAPTQVNIRHPTLEWSPFHKKDEDWRFSPCNSSSYTSGARTGRKWSARSLPRTALQINYLVLSWGLGKKVCDAEDMMKDKNRWKRVFFLLAHFHEQVPRADFDIQKRCMNGFDRLQLSPGVPELPRIVGRVLFQSHSGFLSQRQRGRGNERGRGRFVWIIIFRCKSMYSNKTTR